ncbi:GIY-YIG nuclease family protein [Peptoniphilus senegalensis]|uniref:GIY-YIG nuclease family protein n=1 Tax=Peptoniphilus senegalensis TaxID=1465757 RepID=UPI0002E5768B|nr:GIY-YIG nuclease family protein [Peptoniphilus senegalensis]
MISYVYILKCSDGSLYTGYTNDLEKRLNAHNSGIASKYTASRLPLVIVFSEACKDKSDALKKEYFIKTLNRSNKIKLINKKLSLQDLYDDYLLKKLNSKKKKKTDPS